MLNASYNLKLRGVKAYIPEYPVGTAEECADMIHEFIPVAKAVYALSNLKIISFGPRPNNFLACNDQSQVYIILVLRLRKIQNLIYSRALISMQEMKEFLML